MRTKDKHLPAVTEAARNAAALLTAFSAVEAHAKRLLKDAEEAAEASSENFADFRFSSDAVLGFVKAGKCVVKVNC